MNETPFFKPGDKFPAQIVLIRPLAQDGENVYSQQSHEPNFINNLRGNLWWAKEASSPEGGIVFLVCTDDIESLAPHPRVTDLQEKLRQAHIALLSVQIEYLNKRLELSRELHRMIVNACAVCESEVGKI
jgi:hypothetical protein